MLKKSIGLITEYQMWLLVGAVIALIWANTGYESYHALVHFPVFSNPWIGEMHDGHRVVTVHFLINDVLMALFFAIAGKEIWEAAALKNGSLHDPKAAATPLIATIGGMAGPAAVYLVVAAMLGQTDSLAHGWAIPTATDIAFSAMIARFIFGAKHPAVTFLLLLAIADDAGGLIILAVFYPQEAVQPQFLLIVAAAMGVAWVLGRSRVVTVWPYVGLMAVSWIGFALAGLHPALGFLPIIPFLPHAESDLGVFAREELGRHDTLSEFEHGVKPWIDGILFVFGLANAGVVLANIGDATLAVTTGLIIGKPLGIFAFGMLALGMGLKLPPGMSKSDLVVMGCAAGIGFTVALFVASVAFPGGAIQDAAKMGAVASLGSVITTFVAAAILRTQKLETTPA